MLFLLLIWAKLALYALTLSQWLPGRAVPLSLRLAAGLATALGLAEWVNLFLPLNAGTQLGLDVAVALLALGRRRELAAQCQAALTTDGPPGWSRPLGWLVLGVCAAAVLTVSSAGARLYDTGFYHLQCIRWAQAFPAVPGLGNLFTRLANNSAWFTGCALFNPAEMHPAYALNGFLFLLAAGATAGGAWLGGPGSSDRRRHLGLALAGLMLLTLPAWQLESQSTDVAVTLLVWILLLAGLSAHARGAETRLAITALAALLPTIKLSTAPVLLLAAASLGWDWREGRRSRALAHAALGLFFVLPWLARGVITSGYLVFPLYPLDCFAVDWKMPREILVLENQLITQWARIPYVDTNLVARMNWREWMPIWFLNQTLPNKILLGAALAGSLMALIARRRGRPLATSAGEGWVLAVCGASILFCLAGAPDLRFCVGFLVCFNLLLYREWLDALAHRPAFRCLAGGLMVAALIIHAGRTLAAGEAGLLWPRHDYPGSQRVQYVHGLRICLAQRPGEMGPPAPEDTPWLRWWKSAHKAAMEDRLWMAELPASPYPSPRLRLRGATLAEGFRMEPPAR